MKKLKRHFNCWPTESDSRNTRVTYPSINSHVYKHFSTKQENSFYFLHLIEYKTYPLKLRAARGKSLADPWDDYPSTVYRLAKSWKYNSKRKCQYYRS